MHSSSHSLTSPLTVESANGPVTIMNEDQEPNGGYSNKRRRYSPDTNKPPPYGPGHLSTFNSGLQLDQEEILALFKKGADRAEQSKANMDADVVNIKKALEASSARANRRASEAIDSLRYAHHEGGERIKDRERIYADGLKNKTREFQEKEQALKREHELNMKYQEGIQIKNIEALTRQNDKLREELEAVRQDGMGSLGESRERELQYEISSLRRQLENTRFDSKATLSPPPSNAHESVKAPYGQHDSSAEQLSRLQKRVAELANIAKSVQDAQKASQHSFQGGLSDFTTLSSVLTDFIDDYYVTSPDEISEELNKMKEQNTATKASLMKTEAAFAAFRAELEVFVAEFTENDTISGATNGH